MKNAYSIGEFSQVTGLSIKTLRFYHEKGVLSPSSIDESTGYRFYDDSKIEKARVIRQLREMEFSLEDIAAILSQCDDEADILGYLERQKETIQQRIQGDREVLRSLTKIISTEKDAKEINEKAAFKVEKKETEPLLIAGIRTKGRYSECGPLFSKLARSIGRYISGKPFCLYYDGEYKEEDADFEACFPIRKEVSEAGISVRTLAASPCLSLFHRGPYNQLGRSYAKILKNVDAQQARIISPTREIYHKGPGMIFKGNPNNYLTEIQLPVS